MSEKMKQLTKVEKKVRKAVYAVHCGLSVLNENGMYDYARAKRRSNSYRYWINK